MAKSNKDFFLKPNIIWAFVVLVIAAGFFYFKPWQPKAEHLISVSATGTAKAVPNVATINATFQSQNKNIDTARTETDAVVSDVIRALEAAGISKKDIQTQNVSGGQSYQPAIYPQPPTETTNQYSVNLAITIRDFKKADQVLAILTQNGATNIYGPNLQVENQKLDEAKSEARQNAVKNATAKAEELASVANGKLGKVISIKEQGDYALPQPMYARGGAELMDKANTIQPGQDEVSITLLVEFALK